jgi:hypothetical protein
MTSCTSLTGFQECQKLTEVWYLSSKDMCIAQTTTFCVLIKLLFIPESGIHSRSYYFVVTELSILTLTSPCTKTSIILFLLTVVTYCDLHAVGQQSTIRPLFTSHCHATQQWKRPAFSLRSVPVMTSFQQ